MGGPWRLRGFDPAAWRPPRPRVEVGGDVDASRATRDYMTGIVIAYLASVLTSVAIMLTFLENGW